MTDQEGLFVPGTFEDAFKRAVAAMASIAVEEIEKVPAPDWLDVIESYISLEEESDRAVPILAFAYFESAMERLLRGALNEDVHGGLDQLFGAQGPLGTASAQITLAHALHWLNKPTVQDLHLLRRIRNRHAHSRVLRGLNDQSTVDLIGQHRLLPTTLNAMWAGDPMMVDGKFPLNELFTPRMRITAAAGITTWTALAQLYVVPTALRLAVSPGELLDPSSGTAPEAIVEQRRLFKRFLTVIIARPMTGRALAVLGDSRTVDGVLSEEE